MAAQTGIMLMILQVANEKKRSQLCCDASLIAPFLQQKAP
jgi:hypothetical protein